MRPRGQGNFEVTESKIATLDSEVAAIELRQPQLIGVRPKSFNYRLGQLTLFRLQVPLIVLEFVPGAPSLPLTDIFLPELRGARGYFISGLPVATASDLAFERRGWLSRVLRTYSLYSVDLTTTYDAYFAKFSSDTRRKLKRKLRDFKTLSGGTLCWKEYRTRSELEQFLPLARKVSEHTYQEKLLDAGLPDTQSFRDFTLAQADKGEVRAYLLFVGEDPVSYLLMPVIGSCAVYAYIGYDPKFRDYSPGTVLQLLAMERLFADPALRLLDFTEGRGSHKQMFATQCTQCADVVILKAQVSNFLVIKSHAVVERISGDVGALLARLGLKRYVRDIVQRAVGLRS